MKLRHTRVMCLLSPHGFNSIARSRVSRGWIFVRPSHREALFESIIVESQGKSGEAVYASVGIAVTQTVMYKGLGHVQLLEECAEDPQRGWTIIEDDSKAKLWEQTLASVAPLRAAQLADKRGQQLLQATEPLRSSVSRYAECLEPNATLRQTLALIQQHGTRELVREAERLCQCPLLEMDGLKALYYQVACHLISCHSMRIESRSFVGHDPEEDCDLLDRIELLADRLFQTTAVDHPDADNDVSNRAEPADGKM